MKEKHSDNASKLTPNPMLGMVTHTFKASTDKAELEGSLGYIATTRTARVT